jgi:hypothetical protein
MDESIRGSKGLTDTPISVSESHGEESTVTDPSKPTQVVNAPDPDEDDLDDLDGKSLWENISLALAK